MFLLGRILWSARQSQARINDALRYYPSAEQVLLKNEMPRFRSELREEISGRAFRQFVDGLLFHTIIPNVHSRRHLQLILSRYKRAAFRIDQSRDTDAEKKSNLTDIVRFLMKPDDFESLRSLLNEADKLARLEKIRVEKSESPIGEVSAPPQIDFTLDDPVDYLHRIRPETSLKFIHGPKVLTALQKVARPGLVLLPPNVFSSQSRSATPHDIRERVVIDLVGTTVHIYSSPSATYADLIRALDKEDVLNRSLFNPDFLLHNPPESDRQVFQVVLFHGTIPFFMYIGAMAFLAFMLWALIRWLGARRHTSSPPLAVAAPVLTSSVPRDQWPDVIAAVESMQAYLHAEVLRWKSYETLNRMLIYSHRTLDSDGAERSALGSEKVQAFTERLRDFKIFIKQQENDIRHYDEQAAGLSEGFTQALELLGEVRPSVIQKLYPYSQVANVSKQKYDARLGTWGHVPGDAPVNPRLLVGKNNWFNGGAEALLESISSVRESLETFSHQVEELLKSFPSSPSVPSPLSRAA